MYCPYIGLTSIVDFNEILKKLDSKDMETEGLDEHNSKLKNYATIGHPYMRNYSICPDMSYQFIMSPFMSKVMAGADFMQVDVTYGENSVLPYLFNATAFNETTMKWVIIARMRCNKENATMYEIAFKQMFTTCTEDVPTYNVNKQLQGIVVDWSDTERAGLIKALGSELAGRLLRGCAVHWARSYQRVAARITSTVPSSKKTLAREAFEIIAQGIPNLKSTDEVQKCFEVLKGEKPVSTIGEMVPRLTDSHISIVTNECNWSGAKAWVNWWTRPYHLKMLCKCQSDMTSSTWKACPSTTNAVERHNLASKSPHAVSIMHAMVDVYRMDKAVIMEHLAALEGTSTSYRDR